MNKPTRPVYHAALTSLQAVYEIKYPSLQEVLSVAPHLTADEVGALFDAPRPTVIALPPVKVGNAFHQGLLTPPDLRRGLPPTFRILPDTGRSRRPGSARFVDRAITYAERHWPADLVRETWTIAQTVNIQDPTKSVQLDSHTGTHVIPKTTHIIWVGLKYYGPSRYTTFRELDGWDRKIAIATLDPVEGREIEPERGSLIAYNCSLCGAGLDTNYCTGCRTKVNDGIYQSNRVGWSSPLPDKLVKLLEAHGHEFRKGPVEKAG